MGNVAGATKQGLVSRIWPPGLVVDIFAISHSWCGHVEIMTSQVSVSFFLLQINISFVSQCGSDLLCGHTFYIFSIYHVK